MSVPSFRNSKSKVRRRRSQHGVKAQTIVKCKKCESPVLPHVACASCGTYGNRKVTGSKEAVEKVLKKATPKKKVSEKSEGDQVAK